jgi:hypothetical protein
MMQEANWVFNGVMNILIGSPIVLHKLTHSQLLEGLKCESQIENSGRVRNWGTFPSSQHFGGVEGCAGAPGWD